MSEGSAWSSGRRLQFLFDADNWRSFYSDALDYTKDAVEHLAIACVAYLIVCLVTYALIVRWSLVEFTREIKSAGRVLVVVAHPDDECMFFGPTLLNMTRGGNCKIYLMCMSTGNNKGLGKTRKRELYKSCRILGIDEECITIHNHTLMQDSMDNYWPVELLSNLILRQIESYNIDTIVTFDKHGVSRHVNHCSIYYAVAHLKLEKRLPNSCRVFVLESVNLLRKYWFILDIPLSFLLSRYRYFLKSEGRAVVREAMRQHETQLVWYRKLYMTFSRYVAVNTLQQMDVTDIEFDLMDD